MLILNLDSCHKNFEILYVDITELYLYTSSLSLSVLKGVVMYLSELILSLILFIAGSLAHSLTDHHIALAGASGGCYALIGAHFASIVVVSIR